MPTCEKAVRERAVEPSAMDDAPLCAGAGAEDDEPSCSDSGSDVVEAPMSSMSKGIPALSPNLHALQYAAALASLAQINLMQMQPSASAAACTLPLFYPHLYQSLMTSPNIDRLRKLIQSPAAPSSSPRAAVATTLQQSFSLPAKLTSNSRKRQSSISKLQATDMKVPAKKCRAVRRLQFDEEKSSPVSGMFIRSKEELDEQALCDSDGIDIGAGQVEVTEEARQRLAQIDNQIGAYVCQLCKKGFLDAFQLAAHSCPCIGYVEHKCHLCDKCFNCPANLASHQRWHKPWRQSSVADGCKNRRAVDTFNSNMPLDLSACKKQQRTDAIPCGECGEEFYSIALLSSHRCFRSPPLPSLR